MPSLRYSASSVDEMITEKKASQPCNCLSPSMTRAATGLVALVIDNAISVSSECKRRFTLLRCSVFSRQMGSMAASSITGMVSSTPVTALSACISSALAAPNRSPVLPVTTWPSGSTMAPAGAPVAASFSRATARAGERSGVTPARFMMERSRSTCSSPVPVRFKCTAAAK